MFGQTGEVDENGQFNNLVYMKCPKENNFFPHLDEVPRADVYYFCSPNNPTGAVATKAQLEELVARALKDGSILVFDAAYAPFIKTPGVPTSVSSRSPAPRSAPSRSTPFPSTPALPVLAWAGPSSRMLWNTPTAARSATILTE